jgi:hypothetical protein
MFDYSKEIPFDKVPKLENNQVEAVSENELSEDIASYSFDHHMQIPLDSVSKP